MEPQVITPAQRRYLKQLAHHLKPLMQMGKDGPTEAFLKQLVEQIEIHELIKVRILDACMAEKAEILAAFERAGVTFVQKVGHVYTVFHQKEKDSQVTLP